MSHRIGGWSILATVLLTSVASAQEAQTLFGTVLDAETQEPLADTVVTATSASPHAEQVTTTDAQGAYHLGPLPPGTYTLRFDHELYRSRAWIVVVPLKGRALRITTQLVYDDTPRPFFGWEPPYLNNAESGPSHHLMVEFVSDFPEQHLLGPLAAMRTANGLIGLVPELTSTRQGVALLGTSPFESEYVLDGLSTRDGVFGLDALSLNTALLEGAYALTQGTQAERGRATGSIIESRTLTGDNVFRGKAFASWASGLVGSRQPSQPSDTPRSMQQAALAHQGDFGVTSSGPIIPDRLWFSVGVVPALSRREQTFDSGSTSRTTFADRRELQALGKLTYRINNNHQLDLALVTAPSNSTWADANGEARGVERDTLMVDLDYNAQSRRRNFRLDVRMRWMGQRLTRLPRDGGPSVAEGENTCDIPLVGTLDGCVQGDHSTNRYQAIVTTFYSTRLLGRHLLKASADVDVLFHDASRMGQDAEWRFQTRRVLAGGYLQDNWFPVSWLVFDLGLRYDTQRLSSTSSAPSASSQHLSPRLGVTWDAIRERSLRVVAHYGAHRGHVPLGLLLPEVSEGVVQDVTVDPGLAPPSTTEALVGVIINPVFGAYLRVTYANRRLDTGLGFVDDAERGGRRLVNPGRGLASGVSAGKRTQDVVVVEVDQVFSTQWTAKFNYTWSRLRGDFTQPVLSTVDASIVAVDRPHVFKLGGTRHLRLTPSVWGALSLSYLVASGTRLEQTHARTPRLHTLDARAAVHCRIDSSAIATLELDAFNLLDSQTVTRRGEGLERGTPLEYQAPRQLRLNARYTF
ncbi:TonB-dependent receptor [Myxococcus sp. K15C18031901]|uniref:TonB-dependent receptor n=1 Tax=Myxococcus dinghuensis TaxID=2906761 RepID=UPI0020A759DE|nr:TonB-dependent receptor [Myxococcus dinghuensis]MCP3105244.1 TonB-dependent receptor [Myxococcus dinghuensis]